VKTTKMTDTHWAAISTSMLFVSIWAFVALVVDAIVSFSSAAAIVGFLVALALLPSTWRFCEREARSSKGE